MPSTELTFQEQEVIFGRLPLVAKISLVIIFVAGFVETIGSLGVKLYSVANSSKEAFEACGLGFLWDYDVFMLVAFGVLAFCNGLSGLGAMYEGGLDRCLTLVEFGVLLTFMAFFGTFLHSSMAICANIVVWFTTPKESVIFFSEFWEDDFSTCASGKDFTSIELTVLFYKIESFLAMTVVLLGSLACLGVCFIASFFPTYLSCFD